MAAPWMPDQLPRCIEYGVECMPWWHTDMITQSDGQEFPNLLWSQSRHEYQLSFHSSNPSDYHEAKAHFNQARGRLKKWPLLDPLDSTVEDGEGVILETAQGLQLYKRYGSGADAYDRKITRPFGVALFDEGSPSGGTVDSSTGLVTGIGSDPSGFSWTGNFYVPVRYDIDKLPASITNRTGEGYFVQSSGIVLVEVKE